MNNPLLAALGANSFVDQNPTVMALREINQRMQGLGQAPPRADLPSTTATAEEYNTLSPQQQAGINRWVPGPEADIPVMTPLEKEQALTKAMDSHVFGGNVVSKLDHQGKPYFTSNYTPEPIDPDRLAWAQERALDRQIARGEADFNTSAAEREQMAAAQPQRQLLQTQQYSDPAFYGKYQDRAGIAPEAVRRANVTARAKSRGLQDDFQSGEQSPASLLWSQLQGGDGRGMNNPMLAGMAFGPQGFAAAMEQQGIPAEHANKMELAKLAYEQAMAMHSADNQSRERVAGLEDSTRWFGMENEAKLAERKLQLATDPTAIIGGALANTQLGSAAEAAPFAESVREIFGNMQGAGPVNFGGGDAMRLKKMAQVATTQQEFYDAIKKVMPQVSEQEALKAWVDAGKHVGGAGWFSSGPVFNQVSPADRPSGFKIPGGNPRYSGFNGAPMGR